MGRAADSMGRLGILGGGQLARMTALAARTLGYRVSVLDPSPTCPAASLADRVIVAALDDVEAANALADASDVVTLDVEAVPAWLLSALSNRVPVRPGAAALQVIQDRGRQKKWLKDGGFPVGPFLVVDDEPGLRDALDVLGPTVHLKSTTGGFDGRGQIVLRHVADAHSAARELGTRHVIVEKTLPILQELSVLVARRPAGDVVVYPAALNHHESGVLAWSVLPAALPESVTREAQNLAREIAVKLGIEGLCVVEFFLLEDGSLLVNEIAPRPHNSYHGSDRGCETSQFEQHVRAVFDLPLGSAEVLRPTAIVNLLGDLWLRPSEPAFDQAMRVPGVRVQLYGKTQARPGRKLGHLSATAATPEDALARALLARRELDVPVTRAPSGEADGQREANGELTQAGAGRRPAGET